MWETQVQSLGWEDPLEKEMATYSSILAWEIPWMRSQAGYSHGVTKVSIHGLVTKQNKQNVFLSRDCYSRDGAGRQEIAC